MSDTPPSEPPGWHYAQGDPPGTQRYWDGNQWQGGPQPAAPTMGSPGSGFGGGSDLASPWARLGARLLDILIWFVIVIVFAVIIGNGTSEVGTDASGRGWLAGVLSILVIMAYEVGFVATKGGTPGKLAIGLRVASAETRVVPVDTRSAVLRYVPNLVGVVPVIGTFISLIIGLVSIVLIFTDRQRQTVWDKLAHTVVIRIR